MKWDRKLVYCVIVYMNPVLVRVQFRQPGVQTGSKSKFKNLNDRIWPLMGNQIIKPFLDEYMTGFLDRTMTGMEGGAKYLAFQSIRPIGGSPDDELHETMAYLASRAACISSGSISKWSSSQKHSPKWINNTCGDS